MRNVLSISQILLIDSTATPQIEKILMTALNEVQQFYNYDKPRASFDTSVLYYFTSYGQESEDVNHTIDKGSRVNDHRIINKNVGDARGLYASTYDQQKLIKFVRETTETSDRLVILTNLEITPPSEWRYILWDTFDNASVVSTAPMDPEYWRLKDEFRFSTIKHRARAACLNVVGQDIGLERCDNYRCFMRAPVESTTDLDDMILLGPEHKLRELANRGFPSPTEVQESGDQWVRNMPTDR